MSDDRVARLHSLLGRLTKIQANDRPKVRSWVAEATPIVKKEWPEFLDEFRRATADPEWVSLPGLGGDWEAERLNAQFREQEKAANLRLMEESHEQIVSTVTGMLAVAGPAHMASKPVETVEMICRRFPVFARQLRDRGRGRPDVAVLDEYDVQYLLHALLKMHFDDVRAEDYVPSYAGGNSRIDFRLKQERVAVEVKMTRDGLRDKEVGEQLLVDLARYAANPEYDTFVCFVYDPGHLLKNPAGLVADLSGRETRLSVSVIVA